MLKLLDCRPSIQYPWQLLPPETWLFSNAAHVATGRVIELEKCCWRRAHTTGGGDGAVAIATAASAAATVSGDMLRQLHLHLHPQPRSRIGIRIRISAHPHRRLRWHFAYYYVAVVLLGFLAKFRLFFRLLFLLLGTCAQTFKSIVFQSPEGLATWGQKEEDEECGSNCYVKYEHARRINNASCLLDAKHFLGAPGILLGWARLHLTRCAWLALCK